MTTYLIAVSGAAAAVTVAAAGGNSTDAGKFSRAKSIEIRVR